MCVCVCVCTDVCSSSHKLTIYYPVPHTLSCVYHSVLNQCGFKVNQIKPLCRHLTTPLCRCTSHISICRRVLARTCKTNARMCGQSCDMLIWSTVIHEKWIWSHHTLPELMSGAKWHSRVGREPAGKCLLHSLTHTFFFFFFSQHKQSVASQAYTGINGLNYRQIKSLWLWQVNSLPAQSCNTVSLRKYAFIVFICWHGALFCLCLCRAHLIWYSSHSDTMSMWFCPSCANFAVKSF